MKPKNAKYIDALFRKNLGNHIENTGSLEHDWTVMEQRLDEHDRRRRIFFWIGSISGIISVVLLSLFLWPVSTHQPKQFSHDHIINNQKSENGKAIEKQPKASGQIAASERPIPEKPAPIHASGTATIKQNLPAAEQNKVLPQKTAQDIIATDLRNQPLSETLSTYQPLQKENEENIATNMAGQNSKEPANITTADTLMNTSTGEQTPIDTSVKKPQAEKQQKGNLYYGVVVGPDLSMIKSQRVKNLGYSAGLILGYHFNKHWSAEAGIIWTSKKYYTDGKYFDKSGTDIPSSANLIDLNGSCGMLTFPVSARYNLPVGRNSFFATGGLNSYIMKKEDYNYTAEGSASIYQGYRSYKNSGNYIFASLQFSAGYNYSLSSKVKLRVEPYIDIPLKKIGTGRMPLTSTGLYLGIIRDLK